MLIPFSLLGLCLDSLKVDWMGHKSNYTSGEGLGQIALPSNLPYHIPFYTVTLPPFERWGSTLGQVYDDYGGSDTMCLLRLNQTRRWSSCVVTYFWSPEASCERSDFHATGKPRTHSEVVQPSAPAEILGDKHQSQTHGWRHIQMIPAFICWIFPLNPTSSNCWVLPTEGSDIKEQRQRVPYVPFLNLRSTKSGMVCYVAMVTIRKPQEVFCKWRPRALVPILLNIAWGSG